MSDSVVIMIVAPLLAAVGALAVRWLTKRNRFCSGCGAPMGWRDRPAGFDPSTGHPRTWRTWACPKADGSSLHDTDYHGRFIS